MITKKLTFFTLFILTLLVGFKSQSLAQTTEPDTSWDNWLIMGNKVVFGGQNQYKHSHEIQWRAENNFTALNTLLYEAVFTYSPNERWEIVPDFRYSLKPTRRETRLGFGIVRKDYIGEGVTQIAQQVKWQGDFKSEGDYTMAVRYVPSISHIINDKYIVGGLVAAVYQWGPSFPPSIAFIRAGPTFGMIFDDVHTLSIVPAFGADNLGEYGWAYSFTPIVQLIIRVNKNYKYLPARYINF